MEWGKEKSEPRAPSSFQATSKGEVEGSVEEGHLRKGGSRQLGEKGDKTVHLTKYCRQTRITSPRLKERNLPG